MSRHAVIIGAGITGTLTAVRLQKEGWSVTILEAHHVGAGSSSRTAAGIRQQFSTPETVLGMRYSVDHYKRFPEEVGGMMSPIVQNGYLFLIGDQPEKAQERVKMQRTCGLDEVEFLNPTETQERFPFVDPDHIVGATWCPSDGFLRPEVVYGEAAASARARGVTILQNAPVEKAKTSADKVTAVWAKGSWHEADLFVDTTNAWTQRVASILGCSQIPVDPVKRHLWFLARGGTFTGQQLMNMPMVVTPSGAYCHPENAETLMAGWAKETTVDVHFSFDSQDDVDAAYSHKSGVDSVAYETWFALSESLPPIGEFAGIHATTCGYYGVTPDHNPFLDFDPHHTNVLRLVGFSGHGAMFGPFTAHVAAQLAEAGKNPTTIDVLGHSVSLAPFAINRPFKAHEAMVI